MSESLSSVHIIASSRLGGAEAFFQRLVNALHEDNGSVVAFNMTDSIVSRELLEGVPREQAPMRGTWDIFSKRKIKSFLRKNRPSIVQTYMSRASALTHRDKNSDTRHVARLGGYYNLKHYRHADAWVGNTRGIRDYLVKEGLPSKKVFYISNFVETPKASDPEEAQALRERLTIPAGSFVILSAGRLHPVKGFEALIHAFSKLPKTIQGKVPYLVIVGDGALRDTLSQKLSKLDCADRIIMPGWAERPGPYYQLCDVYISSAKHEPLGNTILEAWAYGKPVIATKTLGAVELIDHEMNGLLISSGNTDATKAIFQGILTLDALSQKDLMALGEQGRNKVNQSYSKAAILEQYRQLYSSLAR